MVPKWLFGLAVGVVALVIAHWALVNYDLTPLTDAIALVKTIAGFISLAAGFGSITLKAGEVGLMQIPTGELAGPAVLSIAGAILLAA